MCPPASRYDPLLHRSLVRAALLSLLLPEFLREHRKIHIFSVAVLCLPSALIEAVYGAWFSSTAFNPMKIVSLIIALVALVAFPYAVLWKAPDQYNPLVNSLFDVLLVIAAALLGYLISQKKAKSDGTSRWLPAAEAACNSLLTISYDAERMRLKQRRWCQKASPIFSSLSDEERPKVEFCFSTQCDEIADDLSSIRTYVDNAYEQWRSFIRENCEEGQCEIINENLTQREATLQSTLDPNDSSRSCT